MLSPKQHAKIGFNSNEVAVFYTWKVNKIYLVESRGNEEEKEKRFDQILKYVIDTVTSGTR